jgi:hypothetical protein
MEIKLPKQWKHWCKLAKLRPASKRKPRSPYAYFYLRGHGRCWRVNCDGMLQCGDTYADFDRWALSDITEASLPGNLHNFVETVKLLLAEKLLANANAE